MASPEPYHTTFKTLHPKPLAPSFPKIWAAHSKFTNTMSQINQIITWRHKRSTSSITVTTIGFVILKVLGTIDRGWRKSKRRGENRANWTTWTKRLLQWDGNYKTKRVLFLHGGSCLLVQCHSLATLAACTCLWTRGAAGDVLVDG